MFSANSSQVSDDKLFVEDVFSTWLYTGNSGTQTVTNGIDLAGKGGLVWLKQRSSANSHSLFDTVRGVQNRLSSNNTNDQFTTVDGLSAFNSNGFDIGSGNSINTSGQTYASWTFREAPKFFDVVTYTGNGVAGRQIAHNLGVAPGMMIVKMTSAAESWYVYHRGTSSPATKALVLNTTDAENAGSVGYWNSTAPTSTNFTLGSNYEVNNNGSTYVAYLFAHDPTADGLIQCGSFDVDGSGNATVNLGWEPQWVLMKNYEAGDAWGMYDNMRGMPVGNNNVARLFANSSSAEGNSSDYNVSPTATGFTAKATGFAAPGANGFIYMAIRRGPMRTPTLGTSVFKPVTYTGDGTTPRNLTGAGFPPDYAIQSDRGSGNGRAVYDKLRGTGKKLITNTTAAESSVAGGYAGTMLQDGIVLDNNYDNYNLNGGSYVTHLFRRAPGFFDEVCYTGTGVARTVNHNLGVVPELMIVKRRDTAGFPWVVYSAPTGAFDFMQLNTTDGKITADVWQNTSPTSSVFTVGTGTALNGSGATYVAYLFASCPGVSKVGSYTGNGSSQTINCGFAAGARFVMIKRTDSTGDWYVWDSARGIVAGNDPHLSLNTTAAEVTSNDTIDTDSSGFVVNQDAATNVNVNAATYIYLAIA